MLMRSLAEAWTDFERKVIPPGVSPVQRQEMRRAFYGGAHVMLSELLAIPNRAESDGAAEDQVEAFRNEIDVYYVRLGRGEPGF